MADARAAWHRTFLLEKEQQTPVQKATRREMNLDDVPQCLLPRNLVDLQRHGRGRVEIMCPDNIPPGAVFEEEVGLQHAWAAFSDAEALEDQLGVWNKVVEGCVRFGRSKEALDPVGEHFDSEIVCSGELVVWILVLVENLDAAGATRRHGVTGATLSLAMTGFRPIQGRGMVLWELKCCCRDEGLGDQ